MRVLPALLCAFLSLTAFAQPQDGARSLVVIVNAKSGVRSMSDKEVADLYLGRARTFATGQFALPLDLPAGTPLRSRFLQEVTGRGVAEIDAYFAQQLFAGRRTPPQVMPDTAAVIDMVRNHPGAIGYLDRDPADPGVRVVLMIPLRQ